MLKLKLARIGKKNYATYKVVVMEQRSKRNGQYLDLIGTYNPHQKINPIKLDSKKLAHWLKVGAQPTITVKRLIKSHA